MEMSERRSVDAARPADQLQRRAIMQLVTAGILEIFKRDYACWRGRLSSVRVDAGCEQAFKECRAAPAINPRI